MRSMTKGAKIMANWDLDNGYVTGACGPFPWPAGYKDDVWEDDPDEFADEDDEEKGEEEDETL